MVEHKANRMGSTLEFSMRYKNEGLPLLDRIITGSTTASLRWNERPKNGVKPAKCNAGKLIAAVFWDGEVILLVQYMPWGTTINLATYQDVLYDFEPQFAAMDPVSWMKTPSFSTIMCIPIRAHFSNIWGGNYLTISCTRKIWHSMITFVSETTGTSDRPKVYDRHTSAAHRIQVFQTTTHQVFHQRHQMAHHAVLETCRSLQRLCWKVMYLKIKRFLSIEQKWDVGSICGLHYSK